jgi:hypothetical protein
MTEINYHHLVKYDEETKKIIILRVLESGESHLYTEISTIDIDPSLRTLQGVGRMLGEALILDMSRFRDEVLR